MGELVGVVGAQAYVVGAQSQGGVPAHPLGQPVLEPLLGFGRRHEELHLHLLELACPEDEVAGRDLVAEGLTDLRYPEGGFLRENWSTFLKLTKIP